MNDNVYLIYNVMFCWETLGKLWQHHSPTISATNKESIKEQDKETKALTWLSLIPIQPSIHRMHGTGDAAPISTTQGAKRFASDIPNEY